MNYQQILEKASNQLKFQNFKSPKLDAELMLAKTLNLRREEVLLNLKQEIDKPSLEKFNYFLNLRKQNKPIAYILNYKFFWKYKFIVNKNVFIPRPETELILEKILENISINSNKNILEIGTGSGCIAISLMKERLKCKIVAIDKSKKAIEVAKKNAEMHQVEKKVKFLNIDVDKYLSNKYDLIISNPPYIKNCNINDLEKDIKNHEPRIAIDGGVDGYEKIRLVIKKSSTLIKKKGKLFLELGLNQTKETIKILNLNGFYKIKIIKDLASKNRCLVSTKF